MARRPATVPPIGPYALCSCLRCGYEWEAVNPQLRPRCCPRCRSKSWDIPPTKEHDRRPSDPPNPKWTAGVTRGECCGECGRPLTARMLRAKREREDALRAKYSVGPHQPDEPVTLEKMKQSLAQAASEPVSPRRVDPRELPPGLTPPPQIPTISVPMPKELVRRVRQPEPEQPADTPERVASRVAAPAGSLSAELESELERKP